MIDLMLLGVGFGVWQLRLVVLFIVINSVVYYIWLRVVFVLIYVWV